jgi:hypothetical protein
MATQDISRSAFDHRKHYRGVHLQQGRVVYDDDWNEGEAIELEERRRDLVRVVGPFGSPDAGFLISGITATGNIDFKLAAGSFYVGGLRAELEQEDRYAQQEDWLEQTAAERAVPTAERHDLAYLEVWEQPVTGVEDGELLEAALGGADTSTRVRTMARVRLETNVATDDCAEAWATAVNRFKQAGRGTLSAEHELVRALSLRVDFPGGTNMGDLCSPFVAGGYLGAENQAIRVQLTQGNRLTWGFDNASRLYRVTLGPGLKDVKLQVDPKDPTHWPLAGQTVELLPWAALLPNGEKLAAWSGHVDTVATSYDPDFRTLTLTTGVSTTFGKAWEARDDKTTLGTPYVFMRVWDRGTDRSNAELDFTAGPVTLGQTGLRVTVTGSERQVGDHWVIAARPETPHRVVPWELEQGLRTRGPRVFVAPLGIIHWKQQSGAMTGTLVHDCRRTFRPLTRLRGCCTYTVGDGNVSHGDFESIQAAIAKLPASGGEICVLPGEYEEVVEISGRSNVVIRGCGKRSLLVPPANAGRPAIRIVDSRGITVKALAIESPAQPAVVIEPSGAITTVPDAQNRTVLRELVIRCRDLGAIRATGNWVDVIDCDIAVDLLATPLAEGSERGRWPSVFLRGDDLRIEGNRVAARRNGAATTTLGGIQIAGGSERVELRRNVIDGGNGDGVTLGSLLWVEEEVKDEAVENWIKLEEKGEERPLGERLLTDEGGCIETDPGRDEIVEDDGTVLVPVSAGALADIRILDNDVRDMGGNGISVVHFFDLDKNFDLITVDRCTIEDNRIVDCLRLERATVPESRRALVGVGGVALADGELPSIRNNVIERNGRSHLQPVCGVFLLHPQGPTLEGNRIVDNGSREADAGTLPGPGQRGGIVMPMATTVSRAGGRDGGADLSPEVYAARVHANVVVAPEGRALKIGAIGPVSVEGNRLVTNGADGLDLTTAIKGLLAGFGSGGGTGQVALLDFPFGVAVTILNFGSASELYGKFTGAKGLALGTTATLATPMLTSGAGSVSSLAQGTVLFAENQVTLDLTEAGLANESSALSSLLVASMDDVGFHDNQCECFLESETLVANAIAAGWSVRVSDNRFKEPLWSGFARMIAAEPTEVAGSEEDRFVIEDDAGEGELVSESFAATAITYTIPRFSAITLGLMNAITNNQGTHCFFATGPAALRIPGPNTSLVDIGGRRICKQMTALMRQLSSFVAASLVGAAKGGDS